MLEGSAVWQGAVALAFLPATVWLLSRLPAHRACRASMVAVAGTLAATADVAKAQP